MTALCDTFGFTISALSSAEMAQRAESHAKQAAAERAWSRLLPAAASPLAAVALLPDRTGSCSTKVKHAIREGVPPALRPALWARLSGADALAAAEDEHYYQTTCKAAGVHGLLLTQLEADLSTTSAAHPMLYTRRALETVRRIVMAYGHRNPEVGYNPLLGGLTVYLLAVLGLECETQAFWLLAALVERVLPPGYFEAGNKGCNVEMRVLVALAGKKCPRVVAQLERLEVDPLMVVEPWCSSLFTRSLPAETCVRVWDWLFAEGLKALLRVGLALLRLNEGAMLAVVHGFQLTRTLSWRVARTYQADVLAKAAFHGVGTLRTVSIEQVRTCVEAMLAEEYEQRKRRMQALLDCGQGKDKQSKRALQPVLNSILEEEGSSQSEACYVSE